MLIYGPLAFIAGWSKNPWIIAVPTFWFIGMLISRFVYGRCCLNVWASQIRSLRKKGQRERETYRHVSERSWRASGKAIMDIVPDDCDINLKLLHHEKIIHSHRQLVA